MSTLVNISPHWRMLSANLYVLWTWVLVFAFIKTSPMNLTWPQSDHLERPLFSQLQFIPVTPTWIICIIATCTYAMPSLYYLEEISVIVWLTDAAILALAFLLLDMHNGTCPLTTKVHFIDRKNIQEATDKWISEKLLVKTNTKG